MDSMLFITGFSVGVVLTIGFSNWWTKLTVEREQVKAELRTKRLDEWHCQAREMYR